MKNWLSEVQKFYRIRLLFECATYDYRIQSVAAPEGGRGRSPPNTNGFELREWESIIEKILNFR